MQRSLKEALEERALAPELIARVLDFGHFSGLGYSFTGKTGTRVSDMMYGAKAIFQVSPIDRDFIQYVKGE